MPRRRKLLVFRRNLNWAIGFLTAIALGARHCRWGDDLPFQVVEAAWRFAASLGILSAILEFEAICLTNRASNEVLTASNTVSGDNLCIQG